MQTRNLEVVVPKRREGSSPFERTIFLPKNCIFSQAPFFVNASVCFHLAKTVSERLARCVFTTIQSRTLTRRSAPDYNLPCSDPT